MKRKARMIHPTPSAALPIEGGLCALKKGNAESGSSLQQFTEEDHRESVRFLDFIRVNYPEKYNAMAPADGILSREEADDIAHGSLMAYGKPLLQSARCAATRLSAWWVSRGQSDPFSEQLSSLHLRAYYLSVTQEGRARQEGRGQQCRDTATAGQHDALSAFGRITGDKRFLQLLNDLQVKKAVVPTPKSGKQPAQTSTMPLAYQLHLEHIATKHESQFVRLAAGAMALAAPCGLRGLEIIRSKLTQGVDSADADPNTVVVVHCAGGKAASRQVSEPFDCFLHPEGLLGDGRVWMTELSNHVIGKAALLHDFTTPRGKPMSILYASEWKMDAALPAGRWPKVMKDILGLPPLCAVTKEDFKFFDMHAMHALMVGIMRTLGDQGFTGSDFHECGSWANPCVTPSDKESVGAFGGVTSKSMPIRYSTSAAALRQLALRRRVAQKVHGFLAGRDWWTVVPFQLGQPACYDFLRPDANQAVAASPDASSSSASSAPPPPDDNSATVTSSPSRTPEGADGGDITDDTDGNVSDPNEEDVVSLVSERRGPPRRVRAHSWNASALSARGGAAPLAHAKRLKSAARSGFP